MDDIDTRLDAERAEVVDTLKSMNWESRLEQARARREAVLKRKEEAGKRPVVRIIDAATVAQRRAEAAAQSGRGEVAVMSPRGEASDHADEVAAGSTDRSESHPAVIPVERPASSVGRIAMSTALGFGLGLGLGASLVLAALLMTGTIGGGGPSLLSTASTNTEVPSVEPTTAAVAAQAVAVPDEPPLTFTSVTPVALIQAPANDAAVSPAAFAVAPETASGATMPEFPARDAIPTPPSRTALPAHDVLLASLPSGPSTSVALAPPGLVTPAFRPPSLTAQRLSTPQPDGAPRPAALLPRPEAQIAAVAPALAAVPDGSGTAPWSNAVPAPPPGARPSRPDASTAVGALPRLSVTPPAPPPPEAEGLAVPSAEALFVRVSVPQTTTDDEMARLSTVLDEAGIEDRRVGRVGFKVSEAHLRFYHAADAEAAAVLAEAMAVELRDFTSFRPQPPEGTIEVFAAGDRAAPPPRPAAPAATTRRARPQPPDPLAQMSNRIVERLRRGEHLE